MAIPTLCLAYLNSKRVTFNWDGHIFYIVDSILKTKEVKFTKNYKL